MIFSSRRTRPPLIHDLLDYGKYKTAGLGGYQGLFNDELLSRENFAPLVQMVECQEPVQGHLVLFGY